MLIIITTLLHSHLGTANSIKDDVAYSCISKEYHNFMIHTAFVQLTFQCSWECRDKNSNAIHLHLFRFCILSFSFSYMTQFIQLQALTFDLTIGITEKLGNKLRGIRIVSNVGSHGVSMYMQLYFFSEMCTPKQNQHSV